jgi:hypothetical protein
MTDRNHRGMVSLDNGTSIVFAEAQTEESEELAHHGVKGMHWGVRKEQSTSDMLKKVEKKQQNLDAEKILRGAELRGWAAKKGSKNPSRRAAISVSLRGAAEIGVILAGGNIALSQVKLSPQTITGARVSVALLAAQAGRMRVSDLQSIREFKKQTELVDQREALLKAQKTRKM